ncbi:MAG: sigma-70 family RNA polymerase sigma factor [Acidobacteria bacterium]|nr:sigma-70 family RNA polymerase sigma factor [Acidobacteriota bacterium]
MATETAHLFLTGASELPPRAREAETRAERLSSLVARARTGDSQAFELLLLATEQRVVAVAWRLLGNREDARDAAQEVYLRVFKYLARFREGEDFQAWLYRIAVNVCRDVARKRRAGREEQIEDCETDARHAAFENAREEDAEARALRAQRLALVRLALATLPEKERAALVLRDLEGLSTEEVARALGSRPVTVRSQVASARAKIKVYCDRLLQRGGAAR